MIKKLFIKNYENVTDSNVRNQYGKVAGILGIIVNLVLGTIKLIIGFISNSVSIIADASNNIFDMASSILTIIGFKLSNKKPTKEFPYGFARYEYVSGFVISIFMLVMGVFFIKESILKIINPEELVINTITYIILTLAVIIKLYQYFIYVDFYKSISSNAIKTTAVEARNDIICSVAILISMIIMNIFKINLDGYLGLIVSLIIVHSSIIMIKSELEPIIGIRPTKERVDEIKEKLFSYDYVLGIHDLVIHNYGVYNDFVTVHVELDSKMTLIKSHNLIDKIEHDFKKDLDVDLTIHVDPVIIGKSKINKIKKEVYLAIKKIDKDLDINDFRVIYGFRKTKIIFELLVPHDKKVTSKSITYELNKIIKKKRYNYVILIHRPYC